LIDKQKTLAGNIALLILRVQKQGYKLTFGEAYRPPETADMYAKQGRGTISPKLREE
jgi:hypothetical protein